MANARWQKIDEIFPLVADLPPEKRGQRLRELCLGDERLREEISAMLAVDEQAEDFIEKPLMLPDSLSHIFSDAREGENSTTLGLAGRRIGAYRIVRKLGAGGMGAIYLAERADGEFRKKAAIKLIKNGADTGFNLRRFRHERQILAALEHPNIARLIDGGTTDTGTPYFVMEYVEGKPLFDFCTERYLDLRERLRLFRQMCAAVAYAHANGIIHRDIKPGNILVADDGTVKLLDFGIAKILDADLIGESVESTATVLRQMTPEYASPEQICGEPVTPASDVYSLGVCLYELLTGERPYKFTSRAPHEIARVVCEQEVRIPKISFESPLSDDLKFVVLKSLEKKPPERYASVADLDGDIARFLADLSVLSEDGRIEFLEKSAADYAQRLEKTKFFPDPRTTGDVGSQPTVNMPKPDGLKIKWTAAAMATIVLSFLLYFHFVGFRVYKTVNSPHQPYSAHTLQKSGDAADSLSSDAAANELYRSGKLMLEDRTPDGINKAIEFFNEAVSRDPNFALAFTGLADAYILIGSAQPNLSADNYRKAEDYAVRALALNPDLPETRISLGMAKFRSIHDFAAAEKHFLRAIEINPSLARAHHWYSVILSDVGKFDDALREIKIAAELEPRSAVIQLSVGELYMVAQRYQEADLYFDKTIEINKEFAGAYHLKSILQQYRGEYDAALDTYRKARIYKGNDEKEPLWQLMQAQLHAASGHRTEALEILKRFSQGGEHCEASTFLAPEIALVYNLLGDAENALAWLKKVKINNLMYVELISTDPRFANLHGDSRFAPIVQQWRTELAQK
jgi:serine/threonine protein kinase/tetratricopeptide (TPR) repeat protein